MSIHDHTDSGEPVQPRLAAQRSGWTSGWATFSARPTPATRWSGVPYRPARSVLLTWVARLVVIWTGWLAVGGLSGTVSGAPANEPAVLAPAVNEPPEDAVWDTGFEAGDQQPAGWTLEGAGRWVDRRLLEVTGNGRDSSLWRSGAYRFEPGRTYRFQTRLRRGDGTGTAITGPGFANRDHASLNSLWQWVGHVFRVPDGPAASHILRLGQWHATGAIQFERVRVAPVAPVHRATHGIVLGQGESIRAREYRFDGSFGHEGSNFHRVLAAASASFNSDRWTLGSGSQVTYAFGLPEHDFLTGRVEVHVNYHTGGRCLIEISRDGQDWTLLASPDSVSSAAVDVPADLLPAPRLWLRLRGSEGGANLQVNRVLFTGLLSGVAPDATGETVYAELTGSGTALRVEAIQRQRDAATGNELLTVRVRNDSQRTVQARLDLEPAGDDGGAAVQGIAAGQSSDLTRALPALQAGAQTIRFRVSAAGAGQVSGQIEVRVPDLYRADYGQRLAGIAGDTAVWWCPATHKVARSRAVPGEVCQAVELEAARHDWEAAQIVVRPAQPLHGLTATVSDLTGPAGACISADHIKLLYAYYHFVHTPTDSTGVRDWWPDALPPLDQPLDVAAHENQPLWTLVYVPPDAAPGDYQGHVRLQAAGFAAEVPLRLLVWNFTLPARGHLQTAFGLSPGEIFRYHGLKTEADKRRVLDLYFRSFAEHRISPYDPTPLDPIRVKFLPDEDPPRAELDFTAFDRAMTEALSKHRFNTFRLHIQGMGGGTFHERYPPRIGEFAEGTPQYEAMFSSYVRQLESHLRDRGWLDMAYVYWFDEPEPRDYDFVAQGMCRLRRAAPGLARMLTEEPGDNVLADLVDIWCPVSYNYDPQQAERRRASGDRLWWYVCTGPKAPYCTLFIDHPASELRVWHWQTWQRNIVGTLVWQSNYWTSGAAFPDQPQNPYEDPMGYVSGYSTPRGVKRFWGNGDGRFLYPPLAAAMPGRSGGEPVLAPPVSSIRWEMLREGVEDYEYLCLLREAIERRRDKLTTDELQRVQSLLDVPAAITSNMTTFTTDPTPIYRQRRAIAEAIEQLSGE